jgi:hypothetical protein
VGGASQLKWDLQCDDTTQDLECDINDEVAADFAFHLPGNKKRVYRVYFKSTDPDEPIESFRIRFRASISAILKDIDGRQIADYLMGLLNEKGSQYRRSTYGSKDKWNPYAPKDSE